MRLAGGEKRQMGKPLDGPALQTYFRRLGIRQETQELLTHIRSSPPSRTPSSHHGNEAVWYPSKKMQCIIKAESHKVEFAFLLQAEHDDTILEFGISRRAFSSSISIKEAISNSRSIPLTTLSLAIRNVDGLSANQFKS